ncbi:hypothetical protein [Vibrio diazotrophicus]|uniref:Uncharacterized protein n=1 Tax=Vibrio diazotrophicus TaxID=685 RepID=A0ABX4WBW1_VIBDI|nr:hypothetical protein [Vibrio diazotrophicus]PNI01212.1 hypothetical protein C1O25_08240 [Vibrio diazotrophicus]
MNYIASLIEECLEDAGHNKAYVDSVVSKMQDESKYESLIRVSDLDSGNRERLAQKMSVDVKDLEHVVNFLVDHV